ncbi:lipopolysaccharide biosynthesis protein [Maribacter sp. 2-571]|uniref:lipopolysaccharide biosynthesis protein n=1 Tax=Maribacter sp. 2-571 TaxID=3417569 RepID=UPI003D3575E8
MNKLVAKILAILGVKSSRTKNVTKHVLLSFIYKGGHVIATFLLIPLTISYLDTENYGIWLTISSFISWFSFFDVGLGNGLRNKYAEARAKDDIESAKGYVSTAYYTIGSICFVFFFLSLLFGYFINWTEVFNTEFALEEELRLLMPIVFGCFSLQLIVKLVASIYLADQNHSISGKINFITAFSSLVVIWFLTMTSKSSLLLFGIVFSLLPVLVFLIFNVYAFSGRYREFTPRTKYWKKVFFKDIFGLGLTFFIIQLSVVVLNTTDNFIITQLFGPKDVVPYNLAYKYIGISLMLCTMTFTPFWSSITDAYAKGELGWIKKSMGMLQKFSLLVVGLIVILIFFSSIAYGLLSDYKVEVPIKLTLFMASYFGLMVLFVPYTFFLNGIGKIKIQMYATAFAALINIPLSIILVKHFDMGTEGVIFATFLGTLPNLVLFPIQYKKLVNQKATGIWNR